MQKKSHFWAGSGPQTYPYRRQRHGNRILASPRGSKEAIGALNGAEGRADRSVRSKNRTQSCSGKFKRGLSGPIPAPNCRGFRVKSPLGTAGQHWAFRRPCGWSKQRDTRHRRVLQQMMKMRKTAFRPIELPRGQYRPVEPVNNRTREVGMHWVAANGPFQ